MQLPESLLALLLFCVPPTASEPQWPHNLPRHMKYFPEDEVHVKRGLSVQQRLQREKPVGVKKMSGDAGEMFFLDNWIFATDSEDIGHSKRSDSPEFGNGTTPAFSPLRPHSEKNIFDPILRFAPRASLLVRDFKCPEGTNDCSSIGAPDSCCGTGSTCINIEDNGLGNVGCCPQGDNCAGAISCDEGNGYTSCPDSPNGGCCLPGYSCQDVGCVAAGTSITFVQPSTSAAPPSSTAVVVVPTTPSPSSATPTPTPTTSHTCSSGWFSCAASLGGGCCQDGRECATGASCLGTDSSEASSQAPSAPVRPTSNSAVTSEAPTTDPGASLCPAGFYVCSAYYPSGCCRVGRDCQTTGTCVPTSSGTIVNSNGVVIVAPTGASLAPQGGSCPTGWYSCAASLGGNCCLNGYACGDQCTATASGNTQVTAKVAPSSTATAFSYTSILGLTSGAFAIGIAMIIL